MMTRPAVIFFGPDGGDKGISKIFLRSLLYSTAKRGVVLEYLFVRISRGETRQNFSIWVYGEKDLARGSGLFIGQEGVATNHHFLTPADVSEFSFDAGEYRLEVFGKLVGDRRTTLLNETSLTITPDEARQLFEKDHGIYFDWGPDAEKYQKKIEHKVSQPRDMLKLLQSIRDHGATSSNKDSE